MKTKAQRSRNTTHSSMIAQRSGVAFQVLIASIRRLVRGRPRPIVWPSNADEHLDDAFSRAWHLLQDERFAEAERAFRAVMAERPDDAAASLYLGIAIAGQGRYEESIAPLREAVAARPLDAEGHVRLGISLGKVGHHFAAAASLREALALRPGLRAAEVALEELVSVAALSATRTTPVRARSPRRGARRRSHRYTRKTMPASSRELRVGA